MASAARRRKAVFSIVTVNANFWTTHREWMAREGPQHLVLGQEHRLEAARCDEESGKLERDGWRCGFTAAKRNEGWTERNQQLLVTLGDEARRCAGLWVIGGDFNMEPEAFGQFATSARLPGVLVAPTIPTFRHGASVRRFDYFVVHRAVACQVLDVHVQEASGISPHHPVCMRLKRSFQGLVIRVQAVPRSLPLPVVGCAREPWRWELQRERNMDERWEWLIHCTECEIMESADIVGAGALGHMGRGASPRWVTRKVVPQKAHNRPKLAADTRWWRVLCNRLRELLAYGSSTHETTPPASATRADLMTQATLDVDGHAGIHWFLED